MLTSGCLTFGASAKLTSAAVAEPPKNASAPMAPKTTGRPPFFVMAEITFPKFKTGLPPVFVPTKS